MFRYLEKARNDGRCVCVCVCVHLCVYCLTSPACRARKHAMAQRHARCCACNPSPCNFCSFQPLERASERARPHKKHVLCWGNGCDCQEACAWGRVLEGWGREWKGATVFKGGKSVERVLERG